MTVEVRMEIIYNNLIPSELSWLNKLCFDNQQFFFAQCFKQVGDHFREDVDLGKVKIQICPVGKYKEGHIAKRTKRQNIKGLLLPISDTYVIKLFAPHKEFVVTTMHEIIHLFNKKIAYRSNAVVMSEDKVESLSLRLYAQWIFSGTKAFDYKILDLGR